MQPVAFLTIQTRLETIASQIKKPFAIETGTHMFNHLVVVLSKNKKKLIQTKRLVFSPVKFPV